MARPFSLAQSKYSGNPSDAMAMPSTARCPVFAGWLRGVNVMVSP